MMRGKESEFNPYIDSLCF